MYWLRLTQANTGATVYVNMERVIVIAPNRAGGANLMLMVTETVEKTGRETARIFPVRETQEQIVDMLSRHDEA